MVRRVEMIAMASALALLSVIRALNVDGPLGVMKSDCFERLAIGQRLYPQDVYKSVQMKTVQDCQIACTMENDTCRSFSFGVSTKGNSTCELSSKIIQETADLKPIGTKTDTDYDLYIKKMGCQLVIDRNDGPKPNRNDSGYNNVHNNKLPTDLHPDKPEIVQSSLISIRPAPNFLITNNDLGNEENMEVASSAYPRPVYGSFSDRLTYLPPGYDDGGGYVGQGYGYGDGGGIPQRIPEREPHFRPEKIPFTPYEPNQYSRPNYDHGYPRPHNSDDGYKYPRPEMGIPEQSLGMRPDEDYQNRPPPFRPLYPHLSNYLPPTPPTPYEEETRIPNGGLNHQTDQNATHPHQPSSSTPPTFPKRPTVFQDMNGNSIVSETTGPHGETITSIITEIKDACFRRVLAGKRIARGFVKRALTCERVEDCQQECAEEKQFTCEGFNYRLDPAGRGQGDCELIDIPLSRLDYSRDVYPDPDYDYYEKERNTVLECRGVSSSGGSYYGPSSGGGGYYGSSSGGGYYGPSSGGGYYGQSGGGSGYYGSSGGGGYYGPSSGGGYPYSPSNGGGGYYPDNRRGGSSSSCRGCVEKRPGYYDRRPPDYDRGPPPRIPAGGGGLYDDERYGPTGPRRGDTLHHYHHSQPHYDYHHSLPPPIHRNHHFRPPDYRPYEPYLPPRRYDNRDRDQWGLKQKGWGTYGGTYGYDYGRNNNRYDGNHYGGRNYYLPPRKGESGGWGLYGNGGADGYWGLRKGYGTGWSNQGKFYDYGELPPTTGTTYLPSSPSSYPQTITYLPASTGSSYPTLEPTSSNHPSTTWKGVVVKDDDFRGRSDVLPMKPSGYAYDFVKEECSLRAVAGFKLRSAVVKKLYSVPSIYDCEFLCFKEKDFVCASYAYRYVSYYDPAVSNYKENCFLSSKNYRTLDYYHDVEPDRDFDIYTMNNLEKCEQQTFAEEEVESECFWRVRSGYSFDNAITRDSLDVPSIVECQLECLRSKRFTCRAFSFRYGPPLSRRDNQNCRLTDWPFYQIDPKTQLILEPGFEVYERGSFGHGCEPVRFGVRKKQPLEEASLKSDQICYVGFGSPARLLPEATRNVLSVSSELDCKIACSTARKSTLFQCMSFSYTASSHKDVPNCYLSDIYQRDLLSSVDYIGDRNSWLFAWDNYNPECMALAGGDDNEIGGRRNGKYRDEDRRGSERTISIYHPIDTWRVYSVSGWPCRRGTTCQQHKHAGFWFCELEGGDANSWDYCCSPHHQCGYSEGYPYQWCYVGNDKTQWRTCSDRYYPYYPHHPHTHSKFYLGDKYGSASQGNYITDTGPKFEYRPGARPDRPPAPPRDRPPDPSLNEYEQQFDTQFLPPPKPGGFGPPRHWPVSYLHKQMPPNVTSASTQNKTARMQTSPKYAAIQNLIEIFKSNDLKNIKYQIANGSEKNDDALFVKIPLPTNFTQETMTEKAQKLDSEFTVLLPKEINDSAQNSSARSLAANETSNTVAESRESKKLSLYRRSYIERTNVTTHGRRSRRYSDN